MSSPPPTSTSSLRLLILSPPDCPLPSLLKGSNSPSGLHLNLTTPYYSTSIPIWLDNLDFSLPHIQSWKAEWQAQEAGEVVRNVGAWAVCCAKPANEEEYDAIINLLTTISSIITRHTSIYTSSDPPLLFAIALAQSRTPHLLSSREQWRQFEDDIQEAAGGTWEVIDAEAASADSEGKQTRNEFGEKMGMERVREALEAHDWVLESIDDGSGGDGADILGTEGDEDVDEVGEGHLNPKGMSHSLFLSEEFGALQEPTIDARATGMPTDRTTDEAEEAELFASLKVPLLPQPYANPSANLNTAAASKLLDPTESSPPSEQSKPQQESPQLSQKAPKAKQTQGLEDDPEAGSESQIGDLEQMMMRLQAVREMGADLPETERKRQAKKAVQEVMKML